MSHSLCTSGSNATYKCKKKDAMRQLLRMKNEKSSTFETLSLKAHFEKV